MEEILTATVLCMKQGLALRFAPKELLVFFQAFLGNSAHLWLWDEESIRCELDKAGFGAIRRAMFGDSADRMFQLVESPGRWHGHLGIECRKL
jgi:hypothetical protein